MLRWILLISPIAFSRFTPDEGCHFAGALFARTESQCSGDGRCIGLYALPDGAFTRLKRSNIEVLCENAVDASELFLEEYSVEVRENKGDHATPIAESVLIALSGDVMHALNTLAFGAVVDIKELKARFKDFEKLLVEGIRRDRQVWREDTALRILGFKTLKNAAVKFEPIIRASVERPLTFSGLREQVQMAIHFYFRVAAFLGRHFLSPVTLIMASYVITDWEAGYWVPQRFEGDRRISPIGVPVDIPTSLALSISLTRLVVDQFAVDHYDVIAIHQWLSGFQRFPRASSHRLLVDQMESEVCPRLILAIRKLAQLDALADQVFQITASFMDICKAVLPLPMRRDIQGFLLRWRTRSIGLESLGSRLEPCKSTPAQLEELQDFMLGKIEAIERYGGYVIPRFLGNDSSVPLKFGQLLGYSICHGIALSPMRLDPQFAELLWPAARQDPAVADRAAAVLAPLSMHQFTSIGLGLGAALGHGGLELYSRDEWLSFFA